ncbi:MAG TPA: metalloregulator ArsR/SmtB family transcription factor [Croceibacterium sp.]|nr:metalloregulator ArsR/SmtB family transcription factor [Croceibacterium sp.]
MNAMHSSLAALGDPYRLNIVDSLRDGERSVGEICAALRLDQSVASKHLRKLREAGLVSVRKDGRRRLYGLEIEALTRISNWFGTFGQNETKSASISTDQPFPMLRILVNARLMRFFYLIRAGGDRSYGGLLGSNLLSRNMFSLIGNSSGIAWADLVALSGEDKGQVSRAIKVLIDEGVVCRENLRAKILLTRRGGELFDQFMMKARERDDLMTDGLSVEQREQLQSMTQALTVQAVQLLADEQKLSLRSNGDVALDKQNVPAATVPRFSDPLADMVTPPLLRLAAYLRRSATMVYRREAGLSNLAWLTLTQIGEHEQLTLTDLSNLIGRDTAQVSRIVADLKNAGIATRKKNPNDGRLALTLTEAGQDIYERMCVKAISRDKFILSQFSEPERTSYVSMLDILIKNAEKEKR